MYKSVSKLVKFSSFPSGFLEFTRVVVSKYCARLANLIHIGNSGK